LIAKPTVKDKDASVTDAVAGRFRILRSLGSGGMGEVFVAEDSTLRRNVALKKFSKQDVIDPESRRRLLHEARAAARLNHPHIASIYDVIDAEDGAYIVMEYVPGGTLEARVKKGALAPGEVMRLGIQVAQALAAAHAEGVIHRDLKPANISLTPAGTVKILDFGLAWTHDPSRSSANDSTTSTATRPLDEPAAIIGTLPYMPPELLQGHGTDARGDIYSLGVTLFELLTGRRPFSGENRIMLVAAITSQRTPRASEVNRSVPQGLSAVVARAMARDPAARYQSAEALKDALQRLTSRWSRVQRWLAGAATAAAVLLFSVWAWQHRTPGSNVVAVLPFLSLSPDSVASYVAAGITDVIGTNLAMLPIAVVPLQESNKFRAADRDLNVLAKELGASLVIDGSVQKYGEQLRVTLKMLRAGSSVLDWTYICDGDASSVLRLQKEILAVLPDGLTTVGFLSEPPDASTRERLARPPTQHEDAYADYNQARAFLEREDIPENIPRAIALFESAVQKDPGFAQAFGGLGEACFARYRKTRDGAWAEKAMRATERALALDPASTGVRYSRSVILFGTGALDEAEKELERVIEEQPNQDAAHSLLGDVYDKQGRKQEAIRAFQAAIDLRRAYWRHHWRLANVFLNYGRLQEARSEARRVTELQPDNPRGYQLLGTIYQAQGNIDEALKNYDISLKLVPTAAAYSNIGGTFFDGKDYERAAHYYRKAVETDPKLPVYRRNLGDALLEAGKRAEGRETFVSCVTLADSILRVNPHDANTIALQALCLAKADNGDQALVKIAEATRLNPSSPNILYKQTAVLALLGRRSEALQVLEKALGAGLPAAFAAKDPDLRSISDSEEFKRLISR
jgi:serine/threonine protein kinase/Flp pilus assembly protein TadD